MKLVLVATVVALVLAALVLPAEALTFRLAAHEQACFYKTVTFPRQKIALYYAVQSGGSFDIDVTVLDSRRAVVYSVHRSQQEEIVLSATESAGEYSFCFSNSMSTFADKVVFFTVALDFEVLQGAKSPIKQNSDSTVTDTNGPIEQALDHLHNNIGSLWRNSKYFSTRLSRNFYTVQSTENSIFYFAILESAVIVGVAFLQVFVVRTFFKGGKGRV